MSNQDNHAIKDIFQSCVNEQRNVLTEYESKLVLKELEIPITKMELVDAKLEDVKKGAARVGYPIVLKLIVEDISHKSDMGAVKLGIKDDQELENAFNELMEIKTESTNPKISVQEMAKEPITEVIIGMTTDPQFGPALMFGIGGILVELMKDVSFRIAPISEFDAKEMIKEIKGYPLLDGFRGKEKADKEALIQILLKISKFVLDYPEINEIDLNPVFTYDDGALVVDARIILKGD